MSDNTRFPASTRQLCESIADSLADYVTDRLPANRRASISAHLKDCAVCREFARQIDSLYAIELGMPTETASISTARGRFGITRRGPVEATNRKRSGMRGLVAVLLLAIVASLLPSGRPPASSQSSTEGDRHARASGSPEWAAIEMPRIELELPAFPMAPRSGDVLVDREAAERYAAYTGKPILEEFVYSMCPRCQYMDEQFRQPEVRDRFAAFVHYRSYVSRERIPQWVAERYAFEMVPFRLPAFRIQRDDCQSDAIFEVMAVERVTALAEAFEQRCTDATHVPLDDDSYRDVVRRILPIPSLVGMHEYSEAVAELDRIAAYRDRYRTAFTDLATGMRQTVLSGLDAKRRELECRVEALRVTRDRRSAKWRRADVQVREIARQLAAETQGLAIAEQFTRLGRE